MKILVQLLARLVFRRSDTADLVLENLALRQQLAVLHAHGIQHGLPGAPEVGQEAVAHRLDLGAVLLGEGVAPRAAV